LLPDYLAHLVPFASPFPGFDPLALNYRATEKMLRRSRGLGSVCGYEAAFVVIDYSLDIYVWSGVCIEGILERELMNSRAK
jgi:hypothetical protein